jgi:CrcB protein
VTITEPRLSAFAIVHCRTVASGVPSTSLKLLASIALGSAAGGIARYLIGVAVQSRASVGFPVATLLINVTGSLLLGFLIRYYVVSPAVSPEFRAMITTGFCGGYTTFSAFSFETASLIEDGDYSRAALYIALSVTLSIAATFGGFALAKPLLELRRGG